MVADSVSCSPTYVSGACNSNPFAADWGRNNIICYAIDNGIAILKPNLEKNIPGKVVATRFAHKARVNVVKWIKNGEKPEEMLVSASVDKTAIVWVKSADHFISKYVLNGHSDSVIDVNTISVTLEDGKQCILVATMTLDSLTIWKKTSIDDNFKRIDEFTYTNVGFGASGIDFCLLPHTKTVLLATTKSFVNVCLYTCYLSSTDDLHCKEQQILKGHSNWVNGLSFTHTDDGKTIVLASASHDGTVRVWRIQQKVENTNTDLKIQETLIPTEIGDFSVTIYSVLYGHDLWVYSVDWKHFPDESEENKLKMLSVSADKNIVIWNRDLKVDTWIENSRLGDVGGNASGFVGGKFSPDGDHVMGYDLHGAFHVWKFDKETDAWVSRILPSGHFGEVHDIQWDPKGQFLISVSADKTTRLHAPWRHHSSCWYEFSRPQTHGYSILCLVALSSCRFISGATEKELRSFIAPKTFINSMKKLSYLEDVDESKYTHKSAVLPSLDLSNKPAEDVPNVTIELNACNGTNDDVSYALPTEDELSRGTLWPEVQKLYYHPNEISSIAVNSAETLVASACKATNEKQAEIVIWSVEDWEYITKIQELKFHQLSVTQLAFSPEGSYLLAVSRDRSWSLYQISESKENKFQQIAFAQKTNAIHKRQLNCCAWSHDSKYFATGSRDGKLVIWAKGAEAETAKSTLNGYGDRQVLTFTDEITAVSFAPGFVNESKEYMFAVGFGTGTIGLYLWNGEEKSECRNCLTMDKNMAHNKTITRLLFRPVFGEATSPDKNKLQLASCGLDCMVKVYTLSW